MKTRRLIGLIGITTLVLFLSGFGTQAEAQTNYWYIGSNGVWEQASNWSTSATGTPVATAYPLASDYIHFRPLFDPNDPGSRTNGDYIGIPTTTQKSIAKLFLETGEWTDGITTFYEPMDLVIYTNNSLTVSGELDLDAGTTINLASDPGAATSLILSGTVNLDGGFSTKATQIYGTYSTKKIVLTSSSSLEMGDLRYTFFGDMVNTYIQRQTGLLASDVRFNGDVFLDVGTNNLTFSQNIWLDKNAKISEYPVSTPHKDYSFVYGGNSDLTGGLIVKNVEFWKNSSTIGDFNSNLTAANGYFEFPVGSHKGPQMNESYFAIWIKYARELTANDTEEPWTATATEPFRGIGVRCVDKVHPANLALDPVERYWIVQPFGLDQDNNQYLPPYTAPENQICVRLEFFTNDVSAPASAYGARYTDNYVDVYPISATGEWYSDGAVSGYNVLSRTWVEMCATTGFGDFTIATGGDPAPVELTSFSARYLDGSVRLNWQTATELNNFGFAIERSVDGESWEDVGFVEGHGTSFSPKSYEHVDYLTDGLVRLPQLAYRLRQMDRDGTTEYSNIVFVKTGEMPSGIELYAAYPNPFNPATTISFAISEPANVSLKVYNTLGQMVATLLASSEMDAGLHTVPFNGDLLPSGIYMAVLEANGAQQHQKLVLNK